jgi:16S rRNA (cytosine1402-N4)-methyltransferase
MVREVLAFLRFPNSGAENNGTDLENTNASKSPTSASPSTCGAELEDAVFIDGTLGTGGHTLAMLRAHPTCRVVSFDRDERSMQVARRRLEAEGVAHRVTLVHGDFRNADELLGPFFEKQTLGADGRPISRIDGALVDAGMSMWQIQQESHGLSFRGDAPLDMRYDAGQSWSAFDVVNRLAPSELEDLLFSYTDERWARRIAQFVVAARRRSPIHSTSELSGLIEAAIPASVRRQSRVHPATKTFAALRLAVNTEFWALDEGARSLSVVLAPAARLVFLTYSSHEDRILKHLFRRLADRPFTPSADAMDDRKNRIAEAPSEGLQPSGHDRSSLTSFPNFPPDFPPRSSASRKPKQKPLSRRELLDSLPPGFTPLEDEALELLRLPDGSARDDETERRLLSSGWGRSWIAESVTRKPVEPSSEEVERNPLARSCKLRAIEKRPL